MIELESVEYAVDPAHRDIDRPHQLSRMRAGAAFRVLIELGLDREFSARQHRHAPGLCGFERCVAPHALLPNPAGGHVERLTQFAPLDLPNFVKREAGVVRAGERPFESIGS